MYVLHAMHDRFSIIGRSDDCDIFPIVYSISDLMKNVPKFKGFSHIASTEAGSQMQSTEAF